jgi:hypothetical protein
VASRAFPSMAYASPLKMETNHSVGKIDVGRAARCLSNNTELLISTVVENSSHSIKETHGLITDRAPAAGRRS